MAVTVFAFALILTMLVHTVLGLYVLLYHENSKKTSYLAFILPGFVMLLGFFLEVTSTTTEAAFVSRKVLYLGFMFTVSSLFIFVANYCETKIPRPFMVLLLAMPIFVTILIWTNESHRLFYTTFALETNGFMPRVVRTRGPLGFTGQFHAVSCLLASTVIVARKFLKSKAEDRKRVSLLAIAIFISIVANIAHLLNPFGLNINYGLFAVFVFTLFSAFSVIKNDLFYIIEMKNTALDEFSKKLLDASPLMIEIWDESCQLLGCNKKLLDTFGLDSKESFSSRFYEFSPEFQPNGIPSRKVCNDFVKKAFEQGRQRIEWTFVLPDGTELPVDAYGASVNYLGKRLVVEYMLDLREAKVAGKKNRELGERMRLMLDAAPIIIQYWDSELHPVDCNKTALDFYGFSSKEDYKANLRFAVPELQSDGSLSCDVWHDFLKRIYENGRCSLEFLSKKAGGENAIFDVTGFCVTYNGEIIVVTYSTDITELCSLIEKEQELRIALEDREKLLHTVNHAAVVMLAVEDNASLLSSVTHSLEIIGNCLNADGAYLFRCDLSADLAEFSLVGRWLSVFRRQQQQSERPINVSLNTFYNFEKKFINGGSINCPIADLSPEEQLIFNPDGMLKSTVIIPLFMDGKLWGILNIDHSLREVILSSEEMNILRSAGLMFVSVFGRFKQKELATLDPLTDIRNRRYFMEIAEQMLQESIDSNRDFSLIMIDIDRFKSVNDRFGHTIGDEVLKIFTARISGILKHGTLFSRYGGEEFVIALLGVNHDDAIKTAERLNKTIERYAFVIKGLRIKVTASFGVASKNAKSTTLSKIIKNADKALYRAKKAGRNTVISSLAISDKAPS